MATVMHVNQPARAFRMPWFLITVVVVLAAGYLIFVLPCHLPSGIATNETATCQNLLAFGRAQTQFQKKHDRYAVTVAELLADGLIPADLMRGFEIGRGDGAPLTAVTPVTGYFFALRVAPESNAGAGFVALARPATPGTSGENEYLLTPDGAVYRRPLEAGPDKPGPQQYFVQGYTDLSAADGTMDPSRLAPTWKRAH